MKDLEQRVLDRVEHNWEEETRFLQGLVRRPSTLGNEARVQRFVAEELGGMGLEADVWQIDHAEISKRPGYSPVEWSYEGRPNVATTWKGSGGGKSLILNGHVDVVPVAPEHHWTHDPWGGKIADGRMYGRGAADMKSGIAAMIYAVRALREARVDLKGDVTLETVIEEECTGNGTLAARARGYGADAAIIPEPLNQTALVAQVGVMWARVTVRGRGAHAERASGAINAILKAYPMIQAVKELESVVNAEERPEHFGETEHPLNYNVGVIRGGDWASSVAEECTFEVRISAYPGEDLGEVQNRFKSYLLEAAKADPWLSGNPPEIGFYAFLAEGCTLDRQAQVFAPRAPPGHRGRRVGTLGLHGDHGRQVLQPLPRHTRHLLRSDRRRPACPRRVGGLEQREKRDQGTGPDRHGLVRGGVIFSCRPSTASVLTSYHRKGRGIEGGLPSCPHGVWLTSGGEERFLGAVFSDVPVGEGDAFVRPSAGDGGHGDPLLRDPEAVHEDVEDGYVTPGGAKRDHGVVVREVDAELAEWEVGEGETEEERGHIRENRERWLEEDPEELARRYRDRELGALDLVRRYGVILDRGTGELLPRTTEGFRAMLGRRTVPHWHNGAEKR